MASFRYVRHWCAGSFEVDLAVVADHQADGAGLGLRAGHDGVAPDQAVFEARDVDDLTVLHHDRVFDLRVLDDATGPDGAERADETVDHPGAGADGDWAADRRVDDLGPDFDDHAT